MNQEQIDQVVADVNKFKAEVQRLRVIETKWAELLPRLEILRHYLFRVDHKLASLGEMIETPTEIVDYTSAFLSVLEVYFPSTEEEELAASEFTRLERLGHALELAGGELKEEVKREFASLKAQVDTQITRLEAEAARLQADSRALAALREAAREDAELLNWLESQVENSLGGGLWYEAMCDVHLGKKSIRDALRAALAEAERSPK